MTPPATFVAALVLLGLGHILPDGVVERAAQVTVFPDHVEIRYHIGCNETTLENQLRQLDPQRTPPADADEGFERYREAILPRLAEQFKVQVDGRDREVQPVESKRIYLHHAQVQCTYHVPIELPETATGLRIHDTSFPDTPGSHRLAAKGRAGVVVTDANVPPILARVEWRDVEQLSEAELERRRHIEARFQLAGAIASSRQQPSLGEQPAPERAAEPAPGEQEPARETEGAEQQAAKPADQGVAAAEPRSEPPANDKPETASREDEQPRSSESERQAGSADHGSREMVYRTAPRDLQQAPGGQQSGRAVGSDMSEARPAPISSRSLLLILGIVTVMVGGLLRILQRRQRRER